MKINKKIFFVLLVAFLIIGATAAEAKRTRFNPFRWVVDSIKDLQRDVEDIQNQLETIGGDISLAAFEALTGRVTVLEGTSATTQTTLATLQTSQTNTDTAVSTLQANLLTTQGELGTTQADLADARSDLDDLQAQVDGLPNSTNGTSAPAEPSCLGDCGGVFAPVCADDGNSYISDCAASCEDANVRYAGSCVQCEFEQTDCDGECKDLNTDSQNCGACGNVCGAEHVCDNGTCLDLGPCLDDCDATQLTCLDNCAAIYPPGVQLLNCNNQCLFARSQCVTSCYGTPIFT